MSRSRMKCNFRKHNLEFWWPCERV